MKRDKLFSRLKALKVGKTIKIADETERTAALQCAQKLIEAGVVRYRLRTYRNIGRPGFTGMAVPGE